MINEKESVVDDNIHEVFPEITDELLKIEQDSFMINYLFKDYEVHKTTLDDQKMTLLYFIDSTDREQTRKKYQEERLALMNIRIDNYEELNSDVSSEKRPIACPFGNRKFLAYPVFAFTKSPSLPKPLTSVFKITFTFHPPIHILL